MQNKFNNIILESFKSNGIEVIDQSHLNCDTLDESVLKKLLMGLGVAATIATGMNYSKDKPSQLEPRPIVQNSQVKKAIAYPLKHRIDYYNLDGTIDKKGRGSLNLRSNNPGNLVANNLKSAKKLGGIAINKNNGNNYIVFPTYEAGYNALWNWWVKCDKNQTIREAMRTFAPQYENDLDAYLRHLNGSINIDRKVHSLSPEELKILLDAIIHFEGNQKPETVTIK